MFLLFIRLVNILHGKVWVDKQQQTLDLVEEEVLDLHIMDSVLLDQIQPKEEFQEVVDLVVQESL